MKPVRKKALELLQSPYFFRRFLDVVRKAGLVGEELNALVVFIVACSRLLANPLHLFVKGRSSAGKNFLVRTVLKFIPEKHVSEISSSTDTAWSYHGKKLMHKLLYVQEVDQSSGAVERTRLLISENRLVRNVTGWKNGKRVTIPHVTKGPIASISTSTRERLQIDDETRRISIWVDESEAQTQRIAAAQLEGPTAISEEEVELWWEVQRVLRERADWSFERPRWFRKLRQFISLKNIAVRRHLPAFLEAVNTVCLIRSSREDGKKLTERRTLKVGFIDFAIAALIFNEPLSRSADERDSSDEEVRSALERVSARNGGKPVSGPELARELEISLDRAYARLRKARRAGIVRQMNKPARANRKLYLLSRQIGFLADPREIFERLESLGHRVKFVHPVTGKWVIYTRDKKRRTPT